MTDIDEPMYIERCQSEARLKFQHVDAAKKFKDDGLWLVGSSKDLPQALAEVTERLPVYFDKSEVLYSKNRHTCPSSHASGKYDFNKRTV